jgi:hypothetical protein
MRLRKEKQLADRVLSRSGGERIADQDIERYGKMWEEMTRAEKKPYKSFHQFLLQKVEQDRKKKQDGV